MTLSTTFFFLSPPYFWLLSRGLNHNCCAAEAEKDGDVEKHEATLPVVGLIAVTGYLLLMFSSLRRSRQKLFTEVRLNPWEHTVSFLTVTVWET